MDQFDQFYHILEGGTPAGSLYSPQLVIISVLLAFVLGQVIAWVYYFTHSGLSYSRNFVQSLIIITVVLSLVMSVIGSSIVTAVGLMGALSVIRFRNMVKDTRDIAFIFSTLVIGMASGSQHYFIAIVGTIALSLVVIYLHYTAFGTHQPHNGFLRFQFRSNENQEFSVPEILKQFCTSFTLISMNDIGQGSSSEYAYQLLIRNAANNHNMLKEMEKLAGVEQINLTMQEQLLEI